MRNTYSKRGSLFSLFFLIRWFYCTFQLSRIRFRQCFPLRCGLFRFDDFQLKTCTSTLTHTVNHSIHIHSAHPHTLPYDVKIQTMYDINLCKCTLMSYMHKYFLRLYKTWQVSILLLGCFFYFLEWKCKRARTQLPKVILTNHMKI